ncbi:hypothetical protein [Galactobacter caseinivorans]|uniref:CU044_5270 family protein n=1 Tax=Galactobacter caseinivorans TaxID=2676123 RepID=A0A496PFZ3_9MICC|nr:hypothetical protein [Galactobacter caseinivorans]RKW69503.1 hypothetical protein DWQ67_13245 [Galactobacter caseinivorans]
MESLDLLRETRPTPDAPSAQATIDARAALMSAISAEESSVAAAAGSTTRSAARGPVLAPRRRRRWLGWGLAAGATALAAGALVVTQTLLPVGTPGAPVSAAAAAVLSQAADNAVKFSDPVLKPGQYLKIANVAEYSSTYMNEGTEDLSFIRSVRDEMYIPADRTGAWIWLRHPETPVKPQGALSPEKFAQIKADPEYTTPGSVLSGLNGQFYGPGVPNADRAKWPSDPQSLYNYAKAQGGQSSEHERVFTWIADNLRQGQHPSQDRSLLFRTAALTPGIELADTKVKLNGREGVALRSTQLHREVIVDPESGQYIGERMYRGPGFTAGDLDNWAAVTTTVVDAAPVAPEPTDWATTACAAGTTGEGAPCPEPKSWPLKN